MFGRRHVISATDHREAEHFGQHIPIGMYIDGADVRADSTSGPKLAFRFARSVQLRERISSADLRQSAPEPLMSLKEHRHATGMKTI